jgi:hypothetical protein
MGVDTQQLHGFDEAIAKLKAIPVALAKKTLRNGLAAGGRLVRDEAKRLAPVLRTPSPYRKPGTVRDAIKVRTSKVARRAGNVGVFVNVKPLKSAQIRAFKKSAFARGGKFGGQYNPDDPFYWQWLNFGRSQRAGSGARSRVGRITVKRGGKTVELVRGIRARKRIRAVSPIAPIRFLERSASKFPQALSVVQSYLQKWVAKTDQSGKVIP